MAVERKATAVWNGNLLEGHGSVSAESGVLADVAVTWPARAERTDAGTSPEELIAAAHAACFSMALSHGLAQAGTPPERLEVTATVGFQAGEGITGSRLDVRGRVPGLDAAGFESAAADAAQACPVSKALTGVPITHTATLES